MRWKDVALSIILSVIVVLFIVIFKLGSSPGYIAELEQSVTDSKRELTESRKQYHSRLSELEANIVVAKTEAATARRERDEERRLVRDFIDRNRKFTREIIDSGLEDGELIERAIDIVTRLERGFEELRRVSR